PLVEKMILPPLTAKAIAEDTRMTLSKADSWHGCCKMEMKTKYGDRTSAKNPKSYTLYWVHRRFTPMEMFISTVQTQQS
ncbi:MAG: hypothetical protein SO142_06005, partial [Prevotella sp.]|nr:hypothetical protein [Prevotella sp.]